MTKKHFDSPNIRIFWASRLKNLKGHAHEPYGWLLGYIDACWTLSLSELPNLLQNRPEMRKFAGSIGVPCLNHTTLLSKIQIADRRGCSFQQAGFVWKYGISLNPMVYHQFTIKMTICWVFPIFRPTHMGHPFFRKNHTSWIMIHPKIMDLVAGSSSLWPIPSDSWWNPPLLLGAIQFCRKKNTGFVTFCNHSQQKNASSAHVIFWRINPIWVLIEKPVR